MAAINITNATAADDQITQMSIVCYAPTMITTNGIWQGDDPLKYSLPLFILQLTLVVLTTRGLAFLLKPFKQPRVVAEIIGGVLLGPSCLGRFGTIGEKIFPIRSVMVLETMANVGLLYFLFLVGLELDLNVIRRTGRKALVVALAGMALPFIIGCSSAAIFIRHNDIGSHHATFILFLGVAISVTAFPVLARILAELKLLNTEVGRLAMSAAIVNDMCAWVLLALAIALAENHGSILASVWVILSGIAFVFFCLYALRPAVGWIVRRTPEGESVSDLYVCIILTGVMVCGFLTDAIGIHSIFGAFIFGLIIPHGPLAASLVERLEDFVSGLLLPLFFAISGLRTNLRKINPSNIAGWGTLTLIIILACAGKVFGTMLLAAFYQMPFREGLSLGVLMNTKGLIEMIILNIGRDQKVLDDRSFAVMVIMAVIMTSMVSPVVMSMYKPARRMVPYKRRTIQKAAKDGELRLLACIHGPRNVPTIINLLEATHPTKKTPLTVYALHLVELTGRASSMLIVHNTRQSGRPAMNRSQAQTDHIVSAFEHYEQQASGVSVQPLTAISPYSTMHEDICALAEDKRAALILLPFHKEQTVDGGMEDANPAFRGVNQHVLATAPCSVAILVDRGLGGTNRVAASHVAHHVVVLFFGGPDDREALALAARMSEHPGITLTVVRFIPGRDAAEQVGEDGKNLRVMTDSEKERQLDDTVVTEFRLRNVDVDVTYMERVVNHGEETVAAIRELDSINDLYIVGRSQGTISPLTAGLSDWSECPELGAIGDLLSSSDFASTISVLVVQQYAGDGGADGVAPTPDSPGRHIDSYLDQRSPGGAVAMQPMGPSGFNPFGKRVGPET